MLNLIFLSWGNISSRSLYKIEKGLLKCLHVISSHSDEKHQILKIIEIEDNWNYLVVKLNKIISENFATPLVADLLLSKTLNF